MSLQSSGVAAATSNPVWHDLASAAATYKVCKNTLRSYTNSGVLPSYRFGLNKARRFLDSDLRALLGLRTEEHKAEENGGSNNSNGPRVLAFARVSTSAQSEDLKRQIADVVGFCEKHWEGRAIVERHVATRSGLNFTDNSFSILLQQITSRRFQYVVVRSRERLARVAFNLISELCKLCGTEVIVIDKQEEDSQQELIQDVLALSHIASCRLYGKRGAKAHYKALSQEVVDEITSLVLQGHSERYIYQHLQKAGRNRDSNGNTFSVGIVRRVRRQVQRQERVKGAVVAGKPISPASFQAWATAHLRNVETDRRGTSERKILAAYAAHCEALKATPESRKAVRKYLAGKCPSGPTEIATGRVKRPTETVWPVWLLRPQTLAR